MAVESISGAPWCGSETESRGDLCISGLMQQDIERFLNLKNLPGRLTKEQAAWFLGFAPEDLSILVARGLLKPLGHPAVNGQKFFLTATLEELKRDEKWYGKATDVIVEYWRGKNDRRMESVV